MRKSMGVNDKVKKRIFKLLNDYMTSHIKFSTEGITIEITKKWYEKNLAFFNDMFKRMQELKENENKL